MDRYDNRHLTSGGTAVFVAACIATVVAPNYTVFLIARLIGGATGAFLWTANTNIVSRAFPDSQLALGTSLFVASGPVGQAIAQFLGPILANAAGWRTVFLVYPILAIIGVPILYFAARDPVRSDDDVSIAQFDRTLRNPMILTVSFASACSFALFLLTAELLDHLYQDARIVVTSSAAHRGVSLDLKRIRRTRPYSPLWAYNHSKLANVLFTAELARRLDTADRPITANCLHPGAIPGSGFSRCACEAEVNFRERSPRNGGPNPIRRHSFELSTDEGVRVLRQAVVMQS